MLTLKKRGKYWHITGSLHGQRIREATGATDKKIAETILAKRIGEVASGSTGIKTFSQAAEEYRRTGGDERFLDEVDAILGHLSLSEISQEIIDNAAAEHYGGYKRGPHAQLRPHAPSTIKRQFYIPVASVLHKAAELRWMPYMRIRTPKVKRPPPKWAEADWFEKLWAVCDPEMKRLTMFLLMTGCRIGECLALEWADVNLKEQSAFIRETKTGAYRTAYMPEMLVKTLGAAGEGKVFPYRDRRQVGYFLKIACDAAKIPYLSTHQLGSHTFATEMFKAGADSRTLVDTGRWKDRRSADHYTHTSVRESSRKADAIGKLFKK